MQTLTQRLANPTRFMELSGMLMPWLFALAAALIGYGLYLVFFVAPPDYQQGETVKIMYIHVPSAWLAMMGYGIAAVSSFGLLVFRHPLADVSAKAVVPIGAAFTFLALVTGSLWGKPMWGTYWVWDARLTSVLILFFLYLGLMALRSSLDDENLAAKLTAVLALVGVAILPIIKFSVEWWNTLHQPSTGFTSSVDPSMRTPLLIMALGFTVLFIAMHMLGMRNEVLRRRVKALRMAEVEQREAAARALAQEPDAMELGKHAVFIWASYAAVFAVVAGMLCWLVADSRRQRKALSDLEKRGVRRRSAGRGKEDKA